MLSQRRVQVFMEDPDADKPNAIHSTQGARDYGFKGALVGGATAYGWAVSTIVDALGDQWLSHGWANVRFKRPIYPSDTLLVSVDDDRVLSVTKESDGSECFGGPLGLGDAPWLGELALPTSAEAVEAADPLPPLTLEDAPVGQELRTREVDLTVSTGVEYARDKEHETVPALVGEFARVHPSWIAEQPIHWLHHSYEYGPAIHASSHIQHCGEASIGQKILIAGICTNAYERKGHHYMVNDTSLMDATRSVFARVRHTVIFKVAKRAGG